MDNIQMLLDALAQARAMKPRVGMPSQPPPTGSMGGDMAMSMMHYGLPALGPRAGGAGMAPRPNMMPGGVGITPKMPGQMSAAPTPGVMPPQHMDMPPGGTDMFSGARQAMLKPPDSPAPSTMQLAINNSMLPPNPMVANNPKRVLGPTTLQNNYFSGGLKPANDAPFNIHGNPSGQAPGEALFGQLNRRILDALEGKRTPDPWEGSVYDKAAERQKLEKLKTTKLFPEGE